MIKFDPNLATILYGALWHIIVEECGEDDDCINNSSNYGELENLRQEALRHGVRITPGNRWEDFHYVEESPEDYGDSILEALKEKAGFIMYGIKERRGSDVIDDCNEAIDTLQAVIEWAGRQPQEEEHINAE